MGKCSGNTGPHQLMHLESVPLSPRLPVLSPKLKVKIWKILAVILVEFWD